MNKNTKELSIKILNGIHCLLKIIREVDDCSIRERSIEILKQTIKELEQ